MKSDFYDQRIVRGRRTRIVLDNGQHDEVSESLFHGAAVRAMVGGAWGFATTENLDDLDDKVELARRMAAKIGRREDLKLAPSPKGGVSVHMAQKDSRDTSLEEKIALLKDIEKAAMLDGVSSTQAIYNEMQTRISYTNSEGLDLEYEIVRTGFAVIAVARRGELYQSGAESRAGIGGLELFDMHDPYVLARKAGNTAIDLLDAKTPKGGTFPVLLDQELAGVFIHEAVGHACEGDTVLEGGSCLDGRMNEMIGSPLVTVKDDPSLPNYGYYPFDDEGSASSETVLVDRGVLKTYLHSRETAGRLGGVPRNARAQGFDRPVVRMSNTYIANGDLSFSELLEALCDGVYLIGSRGGQVSTAEGVFQFSATRGYLVERGETTSLLRDVSLSGSTLQILSMVSGVGNDLRFNSGRCGKSGQLVPVSDGSPHLLIKQATVGGAG